MSEIFEQDNSLTDEIMDGLFNLLPLDFNGTKYKYSFDDFCKELDKTLVNYRTVLKKVFKDWSGIDKSSDFNRYFKHLDSGTEDYDAEVMIGVSNTITKISKYYTDLLKTRYFVYSKNISGFVSELEFFIFDKNLTTINNKDSEILKELGLSDRVFFPIEKDRLEKILEK